MPVIESIPIIASLRVGKMDNSIEELGDNQAITINVTKSENSNLQNETSPKVHPELSIVPTRIGNKSYSALLDGASQATLITENAVKELGLFHKIKFKKYPAKSWDGESLHFTGTICCWV